MVVMRAIYGGLIGLLIYCFCLDSSVAATQLLFEPQVTVLSSPESRLVDKARIIRLTDGTLVAAWHEGLGAPDGAWNFAGIVRAPRDIFVRVSADDGLTWSDAVNVSGTAELTDATVFYDPVGDGAGRVNFYGDSSKPTLVAAGNQLLFTWNDTYCGPGRHGPARYAGPLGDIEVPHRCLYAARLAVAAGGINLIAVERLTDASRDVANQVARATGAGFALAWQEDPEGLQLGEARGDGDGGSGARVSPGTEIWYAWMPRSRFADPASTWGGPIAISNNYDFTGNAAVGGGASRPNMALAGSPPTTIIVYEEAKDVGPTDLGKYVRFHAFPFNQPTAAEAGVIVSDPSENSRRARIVAMSKPGSETGARMLVMWRQGRGIQGAPADFMMRVGSVPAGVDIADDPSAGFRITDLWPAVVPDDPANNEHGINLSSVNLDDSSSMYPDANAKAQRAVMNGDFIFAGFTQDAQATDGVSEYQYFLRWSNDGGVSWSTPLQVSAGVPGSENVIEPRLIRTPGTVDSGDPRDIHNPDIYVIAWGTEVDPGNGQEPYRDALFVTRTVDRGLSIERVQALSMTRAAPGETDEQIQLRVSPDGQELAATWVRFDQDGSRMVFGKARGITPTANLSVSMSASAHTPDVGDTVRVTLEVGNSGPQSATELQLTATPGAGLVFTQATTTDGSCQLDVTLDCVLDELAPGVVASIELQLTTESRGKWAITSTVSAWEEEPEPADNVAEISIDAVPNADLAAALTNGATRLRTGDKFSVTYTGLNHGPQLATNVVAVFRLPPSVQVFGEHGCNLAGSELSCDMASIDVAGTWVKTLDLQAVRAGSASVSVSVSSLENDPAILNNDAQISFDIEGEESRGGESSGGGCVHDPYGRGDQTLLLLLVVSMAWRVWASYGRLRKTHARV
jgi:uncharacterized repeat protein (TIGR01451 family)